MTVTTFKGHEGKLYVGDDPIGRTSAFTVKVGGNATAFYGIGAKDPSDIKEGNATYSGTFERAVLNGQLFADTIGYYDKTGAEPYTITKDKYPQPDTTVTAELMSEGTVVYEALNEPFIYGTVVVDQDGSPWGTEGTDYIVDYANGLVTFAEALAEGSAWTLDYRYGRSMTLTAVLDVPGNPQRTDVVVTGVLFSTNTITLSNAGETVKENLEFTATGLYSLATGEPIGGV